MKCPNYPIPDEFYCRTRECVPYWCKPWKPIVLLLLLLQQIKEQAAAGIETTTTSVETTTTAETQPQSTELENAMDLAPAEKGGNTAPDRKVYFLPFGQVNDKDAFSASWLQKTDDFLSMDFNSIQICEDASFRAYRGARRENLRMTLDWLDFR